MNRDIRGIPLDAEVQTTVKANVIDLIGRCDVLELGVDNEIEDSWDDEGMKCHRLTGGRTIRMKLKEK